MPFFLFLTIAVLGVLLPAFLYLGFRIALGPVTWLILAALFLSIPAFPLLRRSGTRDRAAVPIFFVFLIMGLVSYLVVGTALRDGVEAILRISAFSEAPLFVPGAPSSAMIAIFAISAVALGYRRGSRGPIVRRIRIPAGPPLRIVQVSDLHIGATIGVEYVRRVVSSVEGLKPDLIALTGDIGDGNVSGLSAEISELSRLRAPLGIYYVPGNHEYYNDAEEWFAAFREAGFRMLLNREGLAFRFPGLGAASVWMGGIIDPADPAADSAPDPRAALRGGEKAAWKILLSHRPGYAETAVALGFNLQLSGHTHGGQFFPWTIVARLVHRYSRGLYQVGPLWVYVSVGSGSWGPPLRLGTTPEVTEITLGE